jgi:fructuronate reductase
MGIDDNGERFERSPDPRLEELTACVADIHLGQALIQEKGIDRILMDRNLFGIDLGEFGLDKKVKEMFREMIKGTGAIRDTLKKYCGE